jgi:UDP-N-acetylmuramyl pentapeptide synthase
MGVDALVTVSEQAEFINKGASELGTSLHFSTHAGAAEFLRDFLTSDDLVLVKGSRAAAMEKVIEALN